MWQMGDWFQKFTPAAGSVQAALPNHGLSLTKRSGFFVIIAGLFILIAGLAAVEMHASSMRTSRIHSSTNQQPPTANTQMQTQVSGASTPPNNDQTLPPASDSSSDSGSSVSAHVSSTMSNGQASTQVTVNGQPVPVPQNGSTQRTVGNAQVSVSHSQSAQGSSTSTNVSSTDINVDASSNASTEGGN